MRPEVNVIVNNGNLRGDEQDFFFDGEPVNIIEDGTLMVSIFVMAGIFPSRGQAIKNWPNIEKKFGISWRDIPLGWMDLEKIGKLNRRITILNPTPANLGDPDVGMEAN